MHKVRLTSSALSMPYLLDKSCLQDNMDALYSKPNRFGLEHGVHLVCTKIQVSSSMAGGTLQPAVTSKMPTQEGILLTDVIAKPSRDAVQGCGPCLQAHTRCHITAACLVQASKRDHALLLAVKALLAGLAATLEVVVVPEQLLPNWCHLCTLLWPCIQMRLVLLADRVVNASQSAIPAPTRTTT